MQALGRCLPWVRSTALLVAITLCAGFALVACEWEPKTRPLQSEEVFVVPDGGAYSIDRGLDWEGRHVLVREEFPAPAPDVDPPPPRWYLVQTETLDHCAIPDAQPIIRPLVAPAMRGKDAPKLLLPIRRREGEVDVLYAVDEKCRVRGPYGEVTDDPGTLALRTDGRVIMLASDRKKNLRLVDPWTDTVQPIAADVAFWAVVARSDSGPRAREPVTLWLIEEEARVLRQRALDGTLLVEIARNVDAVDQRVSAGGSTLRAAFQINREVFEAVSPDYVPVRIATDACNPSYEGEALEVHTPCDKGQLVRVENGQVRFFPEGVTRIYPRNDVTLQLVKTEMGELELWVAPTDPNAAAAFRTRLMPTPQSPITVLDGTYLAARTNDRRFGVWNMRDGSFQALANGVRALSVFNIPRQSQFRWLMYHDSPVLGTEGSGPPEEGTKGVLSVFDQRAINRAVNGRRTVDLAQIASHVPQSVGTGNPSFIPYSAPFYDEPILLVYEQPPPPDPSAPPLPVTLSARLLSGLLGSRVDANVTSAMMVFAPRPGVLYSVDDPARNGVRFTAL